MLLMVTQVHTPETCPIGEPGADKLLFNAAAEGATLRARYGAWSQHTVWYVVEAESIEAVQRLLDPGMKRSTVTITPVQDVTGR